MVPSCVVSADVVLYTMEKNANLTWKITDFGFSSRSNTSVQRPLSFGRKTRLYFSPELLLGSVSSVKSDIWSAGCILYEIATGTPPFVSDEDIREYAWLRKPPPRVAANERSLIEVNNMIANMLSSLAEKRPNTDSVLKSIPIDSNGSVIEISKTDIEKINSDANLGTNRFLARINGQEEDVIVELHEVNGPVSTIDCNGLRIHVKLLRNYSDSFTTRGTNIRSSIGAQPRHTVPTIDMTVSNMFSQIRLILPTEL
jgi:serine/threonine protein kinase